MDSSRKCAPARTPNRTYKLKEVSKHMSSEDMWMIVHNKVYNVSPILSSHPGGSEVLFDCAGVDATLAFEDVSHSHFAWEMMEDLYVGDLAPEDIQRLEKWNYKKKRRLKTPIYERATSKPEKEFVDSTEVIKFMSRTAFLAWFAVISLLGYLYIQFRKL
ncbi:BA75_00719T0 [Komagataella pastoris]|uniref:BA75_00719T0 n=1 Tax=Komagataella pastoris TaxID=4922 RepID=A0A1B2J9M2_PICPA|nr:BA75_00719T0 [Komagataella pastoris]